MAEVSDDDPSTLGLRWKRLLITQAPLELERQSTETRSCGRLNERSYYASAICGECGNEHYGESRAAASLGPNSFGPEFGRICEMPVTPNAFRGRALSNESTVTEATGVA